MTRSPSSRRLGLADEIGETTAVAYAHGVLSLISFHRNDLSRAGEAAIAAARDSSPRLEPRYRTRWAMWASALLLEADGEARGRRSPAWPALGPVRALQGSRWITRLSGADLVRLALARGRTGTGAGRDRRGHRGRRRERRSPGLTGAALHCRGLTETTPRSCIPPAAPTRADRVRWNSRLPARTRAPPSRGRAARTTPARCWNRRSASTSGSTPPATWPAPRRCCARRVSGAAAAAARGRPQIRLAQPHPDRAHGRRPGRRGTVQSPDRRAALHITPDRADTSRACFRQAGHHLPCPARCPGHRPGAAGGTAVDALDPLSAQGPPSGSAGAGSPPCRVS